MVQKMPEKSATYIVSLRKANNTPVGKKYKRTNIEVRRLRASLMKLTKVDEVLISEEVNSAIWSGRRRIRGNKLSLSVSVEDGVAHVSLFKEPPAKEEKKG